MRVGVNGAVGQMGRAVCAAVDGRCRPHVGGRGRPHRERGEEINDVVVAEQLQAFADAECDVVVDFTVAESARTTLPWLGDARHPCRCGDDRIHR